MRRVDDLTAADFSHCWGQVHLALLSALPRSQYSFIVRGRCEREIEAAYLRAVELHWILQDTDAWSATWAQEIAFAAAAYRDAMTAVAARTRALDRADGQRLPENVSELKRRRERART